SVSGSDGTIPALGSKVGESLEKDGKRLRHPDGDRPRSLRQTGRQSSGIRLLQSAHSDRDAAFRFLRTSSVPTSFFAPPGIAVETTAGGSLAGKLSSRPFCSWSSRVSDSSDRPCVLRESTSSSGCAMSGEDFTSRM